jgi:hypothetical protein
MVRQEIYGYLLTHSAIRALIFKAATEADIDPDRVRFKRTVRIVRLPSITGRGASPARGASGSRGRDLAEGVVGHCGQGQRYLPRLAADGPDTRGGARRYRRLARRDQSGLPGRTGCSGPRATVAAVSPGGPGHRGRLLYWTQ